MTRRCMEVGSSPRPFTGYDRAASQTVYAGVTFRSRLEATWASFFDLTGITWEYEPFALSGWIPDFRLFRRFLCEVKPIHMTGFAVATTEYHWIRKTLPHGQSLIFGSKPTDCLACMVSADDISISGRTVFFDPDTKFRMVSVSDDGGSHPLRGSAEMLWREANANLTRKEAHA